MKKQLSMAEAAAQAGLTRTDSVRRALRNAGIELTYEPDGTLVVDQERFERFLEKRGGSLRPGRPVRAGKVGDVYNGKCYLVKVDRIIMGASDPERRINLNGSYPDDAYVHYVGTLYGAIFNVLIASETFPERKVNTDWPERDDLNPDLLDEAREICRQQGWL
jgi:hypothetical protein